jgi:hypothetical protein
MTVVTTLDITDLAPAEYRAVLDELPGLVGSLPGAPA